MAVDRPLKRTEKRKAPLEKRRTPLSKWMRNEKSKYRVELGFLLHPVNAKTFDVNIRPN